MADMTRNTAIKIQGCGGKQERKVIQILQCTSKNEIKAKFGIWVMQEKDETVETRSASPTNSSLRRRCTDSV